MQIWNTLSTPEQAVPRNAHESFKGTSYGLLILNLTAAILKSQAHCIGIAPRNRLAEMQPSSSAAPSKAPTSTYGHGPAFDDLVRVRDRSVEADYGTAASPLLLPQSSKSGNKIAKSRSQPEIRTTAPLQVDDDDSDEKERNCQAEIERQTHVQSATMELYRE